MGVPAFFRWLSKKYPSIVVHCVEEKTKECNGVKAPIDTSLPNPNDYEFDNLYLDMNGIIHPCSHPENKPAPKNEAEMMVNIFEYIDRIFSIVRPRRLLYMAIDGVAPRAKMNQQRSRRFRSAKDSRESKEIISNIKAKLVEKGALLPPEAEKKESFDSNCITPGTDFMDRLAVCLRFYIADRLTTDPGWKNIKVILSDANTPGEGEHKIMDYIRKQRSQPDHDPNTKHCLNGADADLIMLGLATHEVNFTILREEFKPGQKRPCEICAQIGHDKDDCEGLPKDQVVEMETVGPVHQDVEFIFIRLTVLREYLERELRMEGLSYYNFERALDDWVFMCFFVGNDFLPHLPSLEIREGAIDRLVGIYKKCLPQMGGYLGDSGVVNLSRVQTILEELGQMEDQIFRKRQQNEENFQRRKRQNEERDRRRKEGEDSSQWSPRQYGTPLGKQHYQNQRSGGDLRMLLTPTPDGNVNSPSSSGGTPQQYRAGQKRLANDTPTNTSSTPKVEEKKKEEPTDNIRLYEEGWKGRYFLHKFSVSEQNNLEYFEKFKKHVADEYVLGLCWVLLYYYQGCASWKWFYPFHYAPFASDFHKIEDVNTQFEKGTRPFKPLEQLMSVFPAASGKFLPPTWRALMSGPDSPIIDFYPSDFKIDLNGKKWAWQGVALLPFVDEKRLHRTLAGVYGDLTEDEIRRSRRDDEILFVGRANPLFDFLVGLHESKMLEKEQQLVTDLSGGVRGTVYFDKQLVAPGEFYKCPVPGVDDLPKTATFSVKFNNPAYPEDFIHPAKILENATMPEKTLKPGDFPQDRKWSPMTGMSRGHNNPYQVTRGGHRMVRHELGINQRGGGSPQSYSPRGGYQGNSPSGYQGGWSPRGNSPQGYNNSSGYSPRGGYQSPSRGGSNQSPSGYSPNNRGYTPRGGYTSRGGNYDNSFRTPSPYMNRNDRGNNSNDRSQSNDRNYDNDRRRSGGYNDDRRNSYQGNRW